MLIFFSDDILFQIQHGFLSDAQNMGMYEGEMLDGQPHGVGTIIYLTNDKFGRANYTGEWRFGMITGEGLMIWKSGAVYSGQILMNLMDGQGNFSWPNGDYYSGQYINGKRNGVGDMLYGDGDAYRGAWRNGQYHGQGEYRW